MTETQTYLTTALVARQLGLTPARVRQLADAHMVRTIRTASGVRLYDPADVARLAATRAARREARP